MRSSLPPPPLPAHAQRGSVAATVRALPEGARPAEVWRSAAFVLLRLNPKECEALGLVFEEETASDDLRGLVLDLLAGAGTFEAQVVIRRLLALAVARRSNRVFAGFVQRLGFVEQPDGPTLRFLMSVYAESRGEPHDVRSACAYALGAAAGQALTAGDTDAAVRASDVLRRDLLGASTAIEKCALLTALGNAGVPSDVMVVTRFTQDAEAPVRAAAALALRKLTVAEATGYLVTMLGDREVKVAQSALLALVDHKLDDGDLERVAELVLVGRTSPLIDSRVLSLIVAQRPRLTSSLGRTTSIENALRLLLGRVEAAATNEPVTGSAERRFAFQSLATGSGSVHPMPSAAPHASGSFSMPSSVPPAVESASSQAETTPMAAPVAAARVAMAAPVVIAAPVATAAPLAMALAATLPPAVSVQRVVQVQAAVSVQPVMSINAAPLAVTPGMQGPMRAAQPAMPAPAAVMSVEPATVHAALHRADVASEPAIPAPPPKRGSVRQPAAPTQLGLPTHDIPPAPPTMPFALEELARAAAATIVDQRPIARGPGSSSSEIVRARMIEIGLDPNARGSNIPQPPPKRETPMRTRIDADAANRHR